MYKHNIYLRFVDANIVVHDWLHKLMRYLSGKDTFAGMNYKDDIQSRWWKLEEKLMERFEKKPDVETILFLIGVQELGDIRKKFSKEQKQDLMHIAICTVLSSSGYYELERVDEDGWPHFKQLKAMPNMDPIQQELFLKDHILLYFQTHQLLD